MSRPQGHIDTCQCYGCLDPSVATIATLRARVAELEAERDRWRESARDALRTCGACGWGWRAKGECGVSNCPNCEARRLEAERDRMRDELAALKKGAE